MTLLPLMEDNAYVGKVLSCCHMPPSCKSHAGLFNTGGCALLSPGKYVRKPLVADCVLAAVKYSIIHCAEYHGANAISA